MLAGLVLAAVAPAGSDELRSVLDFDDPEGTEAALRALLPAAEEAAYRAEILTQIARTYSRRGAFDEAHRILDDLEPMLSEGPSEASIRYLLERGRTFNLAGERRAEALDHFHEAFLLAQKISVDDLAVDAAHMIAVVESSPEVQLAWNRRALALAAASSDPFARQWVGSLTWNLGWTYFDEGDFETALQHFSSTTDYQKRQGNTKRALQGRWAIGRVYRALGRFDEARDLQEEILAEYERQELPVYGYVFEELAELYHRSGDPRARSYFRRAYEALENDVWMVNSQAERLARLRVLGGLDER